MQNRNRAGKPRIIGSALLVAALATACGGSPTQSSAAAESPEELVRSGGHDVIAAGEVVTILPGAEVSAEEGEEHPTLTVLMKVKVTETFRVRSAEQVNGGHVYVSLWQGARFNDQAGTPEYSVADWNRAIPSGTSVMLFLRETDEGITPGIAGAPANAKAMAPDVQGLILEDGGKLLGGLEELEGQWVDIGSMKNLGDRIRKEAK